jgi:mono/diheme cytochrome c family protein
MIRRLLIVGCAVIATGVAILQTRTLATGTIGMAQAPANSGWQLPPDAETKKNPLQADEKTLATGKSVFKDKCTKCHGLAGLGDGPDADPEHREHMDLTNPKRAEHNADGVVFYKVWNGRRKPKMPVFKEELSEQQVWSVVAYVQTLRKK